MGRLLPGLTLLLVTLILLHDMQPPAWLVILLNLLTLFVAAMFCHGELALDRPPPSQLTEFYLWLGVGGVLGGLFNALLAPLIFPWVVEYPLGLLFACLLRWRSSIDPRQPGSRLLDAALPVGLGVLTVAGIWTLQAYSIEPPRLHRSGSGLANVFGRWEIRLSQAEVENMNSLSLQLPGLGASSQRGRGLY